MASSAAVIVSEKCFGWKLQRIVPLSHRHTPSTGFSSGQAVGSQRSSIPKL